MPACILWEIHHYSLEQWLARLDSSRKRSHLSMSKTSVYSVCAGSASLARVLSSVSSSAMLILESGMLATAGIQLCCDDNLARWRE